jgi:hypothetical protein
MAVRKHENLFVYDSPPNPFHPPGSSPSTELFVMTKDNVPGACRTMCAWFYGDWPIDEIYKPHAHSSGETLIFIGSDTKNPRDLGGVIEFWIEDEKYLITKSCSIFIPPMLKHAPMWPKKVNRPILFVGVLASSEEITYYSHDPKFKEFADPPAGQEVHWMD